MKQTERFFLNIPGRPMSDPEGTKELSGIARSVDALFSSPAERRGDAVAFTEDAADPVPAAAAPDLDFEGEHETPVDDPSGPPSQPEMPDLDHGLEGMDAASDLDVVDAAPELEVADAAPDLDAVDAAPELEVVDAAPDPDAVDAAPDLEVVDAAPELEVVDATSEPVAIEEVAPTSPLEAAVEAYVAGDAEQASEIERLALEMRDGRDVDAVATAVGRLAAAAGDPPDAPALELARSLATPLVYERLARLMGAERDEERRKELFVACRNLGEPMGIAVRDDLAESTDRLARRVHCEALVAMGPPGRRIIEEMAVDDNRFLVRNAVAILGEEGGDGAVELVTSALANPDAKVRREALRSLAKLGDEESGELVIGLLEDPDPDVRIAAAVAAGELRVERALRSLIKMLDDTSDPDEAVPLIRALGQLGDPGAVSSIEKHAVPRLFSKPRTDVRIAGYRALNQMGTPHARRLLNQALDDKDPEVKAAVKDILGMR